MELRRIGSLEVSAVGLGCNNFGTRLDANDTAAVVHAALDAGINFFDTADIYGQGRSEKYLGRVLAGRRREVVIATKFGKPMDDRRRGARPEYLHRALDDSLRRLGTDYVDLYQLHEPDPTVPIEDTLGALHDAVRAGKVREIGCSNFAAAELEEADVAAPVAGARFVSVQNEYSLLERAPERDVLPVCERAGIAFIPYYPLASGLLTGKYRQGRPIPEGTRIASGWGAGLLTDENLARVESLIRLAESQNHTLLELAISWLLARGVVGSVIAGATSAAQVQANANAGSWRLTEADLAAINEIVPPA